MKKFLISLCACVFALYASAADKGDMSVGANLHLAPFCGTVTNLGVGVNYNYYLSNNLRGRAELNYSFKKDGLSALDFEVNGHYLADVAPKLKVYPLAGVGMASVKWSYSYSYGGGDGGTDVGAPRFEEDEVAATRVSVKSSSSEKVSYSSSYSRFLFNTGVGADYELTSDLALNAEIKHQYMKNYCRFVFAVGVVYKF